jgi:tryptophan-rich sensory protein
MGRLIYRFLAHVVPQVIRPLHALWNQLIGLIFLLLALAGTGSAMAIMHRSKGDGDDTIRIVVSFLFAAVMAYFSIYSFLRARKISRPQ